MEKKTLQNFEVLLDEFIRGIFTIELKCLKTIYIHEINILKVPVLWFSANDFHCHTICVFFFFF